MQSVFRGGWVNPLKALPDHLESPSAQTRYWLGHLWLACLAVVLVIQAATAWREYVFDMKTQPTFASVGLVTVRADSAKWFVRPPSESTAHPQSHTKGDNAKAHKLKLFKGRITAVDGTSVSGSSAEVVAGMIASKGGQSVELTIAHIGKLKSKPAEVMSVTPSAKTAQSVLRKDDRSFKVATQLIDLSLAALLLISGWLSRARRFDSTVNIAFAFVMVLAATVGSSRLWQYVGADDGLYYCYVAWLALLLAVLPAWPDGAFRPVWTRVSLVVGPLLAVGVFWNRKEIEQSSMTSAAALGLLTLPIAVAAIRRFHLEENQRERQQLKWVFLGFGFGLGCVLAGLLVPENGAWLPEQFSWIARYATFALRRFGVLLMVGGLLLSLIEFRLNDADAVIGRSAAYAALVTSLAVVWAIAESFADSTVKGIAGASNSTLALSISTIVTVAVLAPSHERALRWARAYFQAGLIALEELPHRLVRWHGHGPENLAERALAAIVEGVDPSSAALAWVNAAGEATILASSQASDADVAERLRLPPGRNRTAQLEYLFEGATSRCSLVLLLGRRADGATYTREEQSAIQGLLEPLADLEQSAFLHINRESELKKHIDELRSELKRRARQKARTGKLAPTTAIAAE